MAQPERVTEFIWFLSLIFIVAIVTDLMKHQTSTESAAFSQSSNHEIFNYDSTGNSSFPQSIPRVSKEMDAHPECRSSYQSKGYTHIAHWELLTRRELPLTSEHWKHVLNEQPYCFLVPVFHNEDVEIVKPFDCTCLEQVLCFSVMV